MHYTVLFKIETSRRVRHKVGTANRNLTWSSRAGYRPRSDFVTALESSGGSPLKVPRRIPESGNTTGWSRGCSCALPPEKKKKVLCGVQQK